MLTWKEFNEGNFDTEWALKNRATRLRIYKNYVEKEKMHTHTYTAAYIDSPKQSVWPAPNSFAVSTGSGLAWHSPINKEEGNNPMNYATATVTAATTETQDQRKYLANRLQDVYFNKERPLYAMFGLTDDEAPSTPKELKARIADGKFTIIGLPKDGEDEDDFDDFYYGGWSRLIRWRDPAKKADQDGYDAAQKELKSEYQKALDTIKIDDVKAGLDAVKALEAWEPTGTAS